MLSIPVILSSSLSLTSLINQSSRLPILLGRKMPTTLAGKGSTGWIQPNGVPLLARCLHNNVFLCQSKTASKATVTSLKYQGISEYCLREVHVYVDIRSSTATRNPESMTKSLKAAAEG